MGFFNDGNGRPVDFELVQWFIKIAKENHEPILDFQTALKYKQPLMLASNDKALILQPSERRQKHCPPTDPLASFKKLADPSEWSESWKSLLSNADYCPDGHFRDTLRETLAEQLKPVFPVWIDIIANAQGWDDEKKHRVQIAMES